MKKILLVEDEPSLQQTLGAILRQEGFEVVVALDGIMGLEKIKKEKPDLVLLDLILPKLDGFEVLKKIKGDPEIAQIPVIVLTNLEGTEDVEKALELGATTYLVKANYEIDEVVDKIKQSIPN